MDLVILRRALSAADAARRLRPLLAPSVLAAIVAAMVSILTTRWRLTEEFRKNVLTPNRPNYATCWRSGWPLTPNFRCLWRARWPVPHRCHRLGTRCAPHPRACGGCNRRGVKLRRRPAPGLRPRAALSEKHLSADAHNEFLAVMRVAGDGVRLQMLRGFAGRQRSPCGRWRGGASGSCAAG
jgi:hypothetical protein